MSYLCPVCNGLAAFSQTCPGCGGGLSDVGRLYDYYGPYSPYREIDDTKMDNAYPDRQRHQCLHTGWCPQCGEEHVVIVNEWTADELNAQKDAYE